jgi:hypothetical protein
MKTRIHCTMLVMVLLTLGTTPLIAQLEVEYDSGVIPHIKLIETDAGSAFGRLMFQNQSPGNWTIAARDGTAADFNIFHTTTGNTGINYINIDATDDVVRVNSSVDVIEHDLKVSGTDPDLILSASGDNDPAILFGDNGGTGDARIWYSSNADNLNIGTNTTFPDMTIDGDGRVSINETNDIQSQLTIKANASNTVIPAHLDLFENNNSGYGVLRYRNFTSGQIDGVSNGSFTAEANGVYAAGITGAADYRIRYSLDNSEAGKVDILSAVFAYRDHNNDPEANARDERVGIRTADPITDLHLVHKNGVEGHGFRIEHEGANNRWWKMYVSDAAGTLSFRNDASPTSNVGTFATNGSYTASDLRLKRDIKDSTYGLSEVLKMNAKTYHYKSDSKDAKKSIGFIAQDINDISPELVFYDDEVDQYSLNYAAINVITVKAIQEQQDIIDTQKAELDSVKAELAEIKKMLTVNK